MPSDGWRRHLRHGALFALLLGLSQGAAAAGDIVAQALPGSDFAAAREALIEAVEAEGLVVGAVLPIDGMLARTAGDLGKPASPFAQAATVQFCSSALAWQLIEEEVAQVALCPLSISLYETAAAPGRVMLAYRAPGTTTPARRKAGQLLERLRARTAELARLRW